MALTKNQQWWVRAGGSEANGGGYDSTISGAVNDFADRDTPVIAGPITGLACSAGSTTVTSTTAFGAASGATLLTGNTLRIDGANGWDDGYYAITVHADANTLTVDRTPSAAGSSGAPTAANIGGAHATLVNYSSTSVSGAPAPLVVTPLAGGHTINLRGAGTDNPSVADYSSNGGSWTFPDGSRTTGSITLLGYNGRPMYANAGLLLSTLTQWRIQNVKFQATGSSTTGSMVSCLNDTFHRAGAAFDNAYHDANGQDVGLCDSAFSLTRCWIFNTGGTTAGSNYGVVMLQGGAGCVANRFQDLRGGAISISYVGTFLYNLVTGTHGAAGALVMAFDPSSHPPAFGKTLLNNTVDTVVGPGISFVYAQNVYGTFALGNLLTNCGTYGIDAPNVPKAAAQKNDYNAFFNNTSGNVHFLSVGDHSVTLTASPYLSAGNYAPNSTAGGGAAVRDAGYPGTFPGSVAMVGESDIGAAQGLSVPGAPTIGTATAGAASAGVAFTPPGSDGGSTITGYTATSSPGGFTGTGAGSPITVNGLANGTAYTFTVHATNAIGNSAESSASNSTTTFAVPGAPTIGTAVSGNASAQVPYTAPASNGGSAITSYTATSSPGSLTGTLSQAGSGTITVTGLTNGQAYTFTVHATNAIGNSAESSASNSVTPVAPPSGGARRFSLRLGIGLP